MENPNYAGARPVHGYPAQQGYPAQPTSVTHVTVTQPTVQTHHPVHGMPEENDTCPVCHIGIIRKRATTRGILRAILLFPCGIILCMLTRKRMCDHCGANFGR